MSHDCVNSSNKKIVSLLSHLLLFHTDIIMSSDLAHPSMSFYAQNMEDRLRTVLAMPGISADVLDALARELVSSSLSCDL